MEQPAEMPRNGPFVFTSEDRIEIAIAEIRLQARRSLWIGVLVGVFGSLSTVAAIGGLGFWYLEGKLAKIERRLKVATDYAGEASYKAGLAGNRVNGIITVLARAESLPGNHPQARAAIAGQLSADILDLLRGNDDMAALRFAEYNDDRWLFLPRNRLKYLGFSRQTEIYTALAEADITVVLEDRQ